MEATWRPHGGHMEATWRPHGGQGRAATRAATRPVPRVQGMGGMSGMDGNERYAVWMAWVARTVTEGLPRRPPAHTGSLRAPPQSPAPDAAPPLQQTRH